MAGILRFSVGEEVRVDEVVDDRLVGGVDLLELDAHADAAVAPGDACPRRRCRFFDPGMRKRTLIFAPLSSGLVVRMAMPPWLRLSVSAAAIVLPNRY